MAVGSGQIPTLPAPPPPPCDLAAWLATLDPMLGPGATTADVCKSRCPHAVDKSSSVPPFFSGVQDFYASADPVCIISTMVHASHIRTTAYNDCVFIACPGVKISGAPRRRRDVVFIALSARTELTG